MSPKRRFLQEPQGVTSHEDTILLSHRRDNFKTYTLETFCSSGIDVELLPKYKMRQFNYQNGLVKAKVSYLCTNSRCRLRSNLLMTLRNSRDDGRCYCCKHYPNLFPEYLAVTSR
jgi:hypothetical protein